jgi:hypothetical protein
MGPVGCGTARAHGRPQAGTTGINTEFSNSPEGAESSRTENVTSPFQGKAPEKWHIHFHLLATNFHPEAYLPN